MANLKLIRTRIKSVQSTQKITKAMRLVAAAKVRRAQARVLAGRPYNESLKRLMKDCCNNLDEATLKSMPLLVARSVKRVGLWVVSSDRGLCGSYNSQLFRKTLERIEELSKQNIEVVLVTIGSKANTFFKYSKLERIKTYMHLPAVPTVEESKMLAEFAVNCFTDNTIDQVEIISTKFISMLNSQVNTLNYLPVELHAQTPEMSKVISPLKLFEPSMEEVLKDNLIPLYLQNVFYQVLIEASAAELAARMNAMTNASNNARDLINSLTLVYNKARQASITQEILEIVGGAEALKN